MSFAVAGCVVQPGGEVCRHRKREAAAQDPADVRQRQHPQPLHFQPPGVVRGIHTGRLLQQ